MPPKGAVSRRTRTAQSPDGFQSPNLPPLRGTPSSRRQFTYGGKPEPPPSRPNFVAGKDRRLDLGGAVQEELERQSKSRKERERQAFEEANRNRRFESEEVDELSMDEHTFQQTSAGGKPHLPFHQPSNKNRSLHDDVIDFDDARSFGVESDFYGDATIASTPASVLPLAPSNQLPKMPRTGKTTKATSQMTVSPPEPMTQLQEGIRRSEESEDPIGGHRGNAQSSRRGQSTTPSSSHSKRLQEQRNYPEDSEELLGGEKDPEKKLAETRSSRLMSKAPVKMVSPKRASRPISREFQPQTTDQGQSETATPALEQRRTPYKKSMPNQSSQHLGAQKQAGTSATGSHQLGSFWNHFTPKQHRTRQTLEGRSREHRPSGHAGETLLAQTKAFILSSSPFRRSSSLYASVESQQDDELQQMVDREDRASERAAVREAQAQRAEARRRAWQEWWTRTKTKLPFTSQRQRLELGDEYLLDGQREWTWLRWLNPFTYLVLVVSHLNKVANKVFTFTGLCLDYCWIWICNNYMALGLAALAISIMFASTNDGIQEQLSSIPRFQLSSPIAWEKVEDMSHYFKQLIPSFSSRRGSFVLDDLISMDEDSRSRVDHVIKAIEKEINRAGTAIESHEIALGKLEHLLPSVIHMKLQNGNPVIADSFWHALRDLIREDEVFMTFEEGHDSLKIPSDRQWNAIISRLSRDPAFNNKLNLSLEHLETRINKGVANSWETWIRNNNEMIRQQHRVKPTEAAEADNKHAINALIKQQFKESEASGRVISRNEFLHHITNELTAHRAEVSAQMKELSPQLTKLAQDSAKLALQDLPQNMNRNEVENLVANLVRKGIADLNLQAMANGQIKAHWEEELKHKIDYFGIAAGAVINTKYTSPIADPKNTPPISDKSLAEAKRKPDLRNKLKSFPASKVQLGWQEDGDCWCAARSRSRRDQPHGAIVALTLGYKIIPTHFVLEHILPGATIDPDSRPRNVEIYVSIEDGALRSHVENFSGAHFPDDRDDWNYTPTHGFDGSYVKVGEFVYEDAERMDGKYLYRFSEELEHLQAATENVIVRATSNYGAKHHTCFYRLRLYGERVEHGGSQSS